MKFLLFSLFALVSLGSSAFAQVSPIRMEVLQRQKTDSKGKSNESKTQVRSLDITLQNISRQSYDNLVVKYWFFTRDVNKGEPSVFKHGERKSSLAAGKKELIESEQVSASFTEDHVVVERSKSRGNSKNGSSSRAKKVEGKGDKIVGYGVRLLDGDKVLAEVFSPQGLREKVK
jgi:hypothetical protein